MGAESSNEPEVAPVSPVLSVPQCSPGFPVTMPSTTPVSEMDRRIIQTLAAPEMTHRRLWQAARHVPQLLMESEPSSAVASTELYGSLSLDITNPLPEDCHQRQQDWAQYYVNTTSDVDFVVKLRQNTPPDAVMRCLLGKGPWHRVAETHVRKFAATQYTLRGNFCEGGDVMEVFLDVTCISDPVHYARFKGRQRAFRMVFLEMRSRMEAQFAAQGALAFDAYVHLLKALLLERCLATRSPDSRPRASASSRSRLAT